MQVKKENRVIVRIWNSGLKGGANVGHVSIETPSNYMSLWPDDPRKDKEQSKNSRNLGIFSAISHDFVCSADNDIKNEGRPPEQIYCLYSLNSQDIEDEFHEITDDPDFKGWTLIGNNLLLNKGNAHSCASLAYTLLKAGGLYKIVSSLYSSYVSSVVAPDQLAEVVKKAKQAELRIKPITEKFGPFSRESIHDCIENENIVTSQSWCAKITPYLAIGVGFFAVATTVAARNKYCPEILEDTCDMIRRFIG